MFKLGLQSGLLSCLWKRELNLRKVSSTTQCSFPETPALGSGPGQLVSLPKEGLFLCPQSESGEGLNPA